MLKNQPRMIVKKSVMMKKKKKKKLIKDIKQNEKNKKCIQEIFSCPKW